MAEKNLMTFENPVLKAYCFYLAVLGVKMLAMSLLTGRQRFKKLVFANPEDTKKLKNAKVKYDDPDVERVRRAHLNDLENITVFTFVAWLFLMTDPPALVAINLFRVFAIARILHTLVYAVFVVPQPARAITWGIAYGITMYMAIHCLVHFMAAM